MTPPQGTHLHGTLDALILKTLSHGPRHGYGVARWIEETTGETIRVEEGSLYPALYRLEKQGFLASEWGRTELDRRAKFYRLTEKGESRLGQETEEWRRFMEGVCRVLLPSFAAEAM